VDNTRPGQKMLRLRTRREHQASALIHRRTHSALSSRQKESSCDRRSHHRRSIFWVPGRSAIGLEGFIPVNFVLDAGLSTISPPSRSCTRPLRLIAPPLTMWLTKGHRVDGVPLCCSTLHVGMSGRCSRAVGPQHAGSNERKFVAIGPIQSRVMRPFMVGAGIAAVR
jgi:hypothetical protein